MVQTADAIFILHQENSKSVVYEVHDDGGHEERSHAGHHTVDRDDENCLISFVVHVPWRRVVLILLDT